MPIQSHAGCPRRRLLPPACPVPPSSCIALLPTHAHVRHQHSRATTRHLHPICSKTGRPSTKRHGGARKAASQGSTPKQKGAEEGQGARVSLSPPDGCTLGGQPRRGVPGTRGSSQEPRPGQTAHLALCGAHQQLQPSCGTPAGCLPGGGWAGSQPALPGWPAGDSREKTGWAGSRQGTHALCQNQPGSLAAPPDVAHPWPTLATLCCAAQGAPNRDRCACCSDSSRPSAWRFNVSGCCCGRCSCSCDCACLG